MPEGNAEEPHQGFFIFGCCFSNLKERAHSARIINQAIARFKRHGIPVTGTVITTRINLTPCGSHFDSHA